MPEWTCLWKRRVFWEVGAAQNKAGDYLDIRAEMDLFWAVSVCAWPDQVNGYKPTPLRFEVYDIP